MLFVNHKNAQERKGVLQLKRVDRCSRALDLGSPSMQNSLKLCNRALTGNAIA